MTENRTAVDPPDPTQDTVVLSQDTVVLPAVPPARPHRRHRLVVGLAALALTLGTVGVVAGLNRGMTTAPSSGAGTPTAASPRPSPSPSGSASEAARPPAARATGAAPSRSARPRRTPSSTAARRPAGRAALTARYRTVSSRLFGYVGEVLVRNDGNAHARGWTLVLTLASGRVDNVSGASFRQEGRTVTFSGGRLGAGEEVTIRFSVRGAAALGRPGPTGCTVQDRPCATD